MVCSQACLPGFPTQWGMGTLRGIRTAALRSPEAHFDDAEIGGLTRSPDLPPQFQVGCFVFPELCSLCFRGDGGEAGSWLSWHVGHHLAVTQIDTLQLR